MDEEHEEEEDKSPFEQSAVDVTMLTAEATKRKAIEIMVCWRKIEKTCIFEVVYFMTTSSEELRRVTRHTTERCTPQSIYQHLS
mmetsp:Transcript_12262/g.17107  ORF Transcript_12262/g.17107 Transcript_12262/m.17107 type:complete len:84 (-) Transcript_12262:43-294(-)